MRRRTFIMRDCSGRSELYGETEGVILLLYETLYKKPETPIGVVRFVNAMPWSLASHSATMLFKCGHDAPNVRVCQLHMHINDGHGHVCYHKNRPTVPSTKEQFLSRSTATIDEGEHISSTMSNPDFALYDTIAATVDKYTKAYNPAQPGTNIPDRGAILSLVTPDFLIHYGHEALVASQPPLQHPEDGEAWMDHWRGITQMFDTWTTERTDLFVDVRRKSAIVRSRYTLVKGEAKVINDMVQFMNMNESGEKVREIVEFIDARSFDDFERILQAEGK